MSYVYHLSKTGLTPQYGDTTKIAKISRRRKKKTPSTLATPHVPDKSLAFSLIADFLDLPALAALVTVLGPRGRGAPEVDAMIERALVRANRAPLCSGRAPVDGEAPNGITDTRDSYHLDRTTAPRRRLVALCGALPASARRALGPCVVALRDACARCTYEMPFPEHWNEESNDEY